MPLPTLQQQSISDNNDYYTAIYNNYLVLVRTATHGVQGIHTSIGFQFATSYDVPSRALTASRYE